MNSTSRTGLRIVCGPICSGPRATGHELTGTADPPVSVGGGQPERLSRLRAATGPWANAPPSDIQLRLSAPPGVAASGEKMRPSPPRTKTSSRPSRLRATARSPGVPPGGPAPRSTDRPPPRPIGARCASTRRCARRPRRTARTLAVLVCATTGPRGHAPPNDVHSGSRRCPGTLGGDADSTVAAAGEELEPPVLGWRRRSDGHRRRLPVPRRRAPIRPTTSRSPPAAPAATRRPRSRDLTARAACRGCGPRPAAGQRAAERRSGAGERAAAVFCQRCWTRPRRPHETSSRSSRLRASTGSPASHPPDPRRDRSVAPTNRCSGAWRHTCR